ADPKWPKEADPSEFRGSRMGHGDSDTSPVSSMKGRELSRDGWLFLTFVCGIGVVSIGIRGRRRGFGALPWTSLQSCRGRPVGSSALPAGRELSAPVVALEAAGRVWHRGVECWFRGLWWLGAGSLTAL